MELQPNLLSNGFDTWAFRVTSMANKFCKLEAYDEPTYLLSRIKALHAAVLERAIRDLEDGVERVHTKRVIWWFERPFINIEQTKKMNITFQDCVELCSLTDKHIEYIKERIVRAKSRLKKMGYTFG